MAVSRPILLAVLGLVLVTAAFIATRPKAEEPEQDAPKAASSEPVVGARSQDRPASKDPTAALDAPSRALLSKALDRGRLVVLFVRQAGGADDRATARSVAALRRSRPPRTEIVSVPVKRIADYTPITGPLGVSQAPAVVLLTRDKSLVLEGYVDAASLQQDVADALK